MNPLKIQISEIIKQAIKEVKVDEMPQEKQKSIITKLEASIKLIYKL